MVVSNARAGGRDVSGAAHGTPLWREDREFAPRRPALPGNVTADVAIVGAGFTGLWAAYYLLQADPSLKVVLLEREFAGFGRPGATAGGRRRSSRSPSPASNSCIRTAPPWICRPR